MPNEQFFKLQSKLYLVTTCLKWPYFNVYLEGHIRQVWLYIMANFYSASFLKEQSASRHVTSLACIILIPSQLVFALVP